MVAGRSPVHADKMIGMHWLLNGSLHSELQTMDQTKHTLDLRISPEMSTARPFQHDGGEGGRTKSRSSSNML